MSYIGATGLTEYEERFDTIEQEIDSNATYINTLVGIPDPIHLATFGINVFNPSLYGLVERAEVNIGLLQSELETEGTTITGIQEEITAIQTEITGIQDEITLLQGEITGVQGEISVIDGDLLFLNTFTLPAMVSATSAAAVLAADAELKANKSLSIWDESGDNVYHKKVGNVGIGTTFGSVLNNKLEVGGSVNISAGSKYKINNVPFSYSDLAGTPPVSSKWTNATDVSTNIYYSTGNVGIGVTSAINNKLEVGGSINIPTGSKYKINNVDLSYNDLTNKLTQGTNISIVNNVINNTYELPTATSTTLGSVRPDNSTITISNGVISSTSTASGASISLDGSINNRSYGWTGSTSLLGRVGVAGNYSTGSAVEDVVLRSQGKLILQSGITNPAMVIDTTNNAFLRNAVGIGTDTISAGNMLDVGGTFKIAYSSGAERLTITSTGVQVNNTLNVSSGFNSGGLIRFGGFSDDSSFDLATIQNREYATNKSELLIFKGDNIEGLTGVDRIRLRAGAIAFDTFSADATTSANTENIRVFINGNGDVGIGTTQPTAELDIVGVNSGFGTTLDMLNMRSDANWGLKFVQNLTIAGNIIYNIVHRYNAVNNTLMTFSNANVGIGTTSPETTFDINGNLLIRAYEAGTGGTKGVFFRTGFISTNQYNCSILAYDHNAASAANGLSINGFGGVSFCTGANTRQERMRITQGGDVGIGRTPQASMKLDVNGNMFVEENIHFNTQYNGGGRNFPCNKINLWGTGREYGFGISSYTLDYCSAGKHRFYSGSGGTNFGTQRMIIEETGVTIANNLSVGGNLYSASYIYSGSFLQGAGGGGSYRLVRPDSWVRLKSTDETIHLDFAAGKLYAHDTLDVQGITNLNNFTYVRMQSIANTGNEFVCIVGNEAQGGYYNKVLYIAYATFTGFHRCYIEDELCNDDNIDIFKNDYVGRVVISTGKIKTDISRKKEGEDNEHEWYSLEGKEGITIEDALPIIQLSRVRKDKRVYGVLGDPKRGTNNKGRIIINGCGEGAICVANTNGNIENGDYIQTSDLLGYGEKQDDDIHRNYTIAKAVMDCTFELDNPNYECKELSSGVRVAMIACVYKAS